MIKKILLVVGVTLVLGGLNAITPTLIINMDNEARLPNAFRVINELHVSGSSQFSEKSLCVMIPAIPSKDVTIVDLREESHGFVDGKAISWYYPKNWGNVGKSIKAISVDENERLKSLMSKSVTLIYRKSLIPVPTTVSQVQSEEEIVTKYGLKYYRFPITDHTRPKDEQVDQFVAMMQKREGWMHFHCQAGKGRTTTVLAMYDMMINAKNKTFEEIISRQREIGGIDLLAPADVGEWKYPYLIERAEFIKKFYQYCQTDFTVSWSEWVKNH